MDKIDLNWQSIGHLLEEAAYLHKDKPLFIYEGEKVSFTEINRRVNQLANALKALGVAKEDKISVMLPNGFDFPISWLAIAKLGAIMVPTNINYKEHDLVYILTNSEASAIILHVDYLPLLKQVKDQIPGIKHVVVVGSAPVEYHSCQKLIKHASDQFSIENIEENDLVNIQYTSGTTGFPKGCMLPHRYWLLTGVLVSEDFQLDSEDVNLTAQPFYYLDPQWNNHPVSDDRDSFSDYAALFSLEILANR